jgi:hypothetical protein
MLSPAKRQLWEVLCKMEDEKAESALAFFL